MVVLDDLIESRIVAGVAIAAGAAILAPVLVPVVLGVARPLVKSAIKAGFVFYDRGVEAVAQIREVTEDLVAEVKAELKPAVPQAEEAPAGPNAASEATS